MLNLQRSMKIFVCMVLVATFLGCAATRTKESTGGYVDDTVITTKVKSAIFADPELKVLQINVETFKGIVQLSGFVDSQQAAARAADLAGTVTGVKGVKNNLIVK
jgi:osmotically-inducible protein OsmY